MTKRIVKKSVPPGEWPPEFEAAIRAQGEELDRYRDSDEGRGFTRAIETIDRELTEEQTLRQDAERRARQSEHREKQAREEAQRAGARADAADARVDAVTKLAAASLVPDEARTDGVRTGESAPQSADASRQRGGLPSGVVLDLFADISNGRKALADALQRRAWPKGARLTAPSRGRGRDATWDPLRLAELILGQIEQRRGADEALKAKRKMQRVFADDQRLRAWRDDWEAVATRSEWLGLAATTRRTEGMNRG